MENKDDRLIKLCEGRRDDEFHKSCQGHISPQNQRKNVVSKSLLLGFFAVFLICEIFHLLSISILYSSILNLIHIETTKKF